MERSSDAATQGLQKVSPTSALEILKETFGLPLSAIEGVSKTLKWKFSHW